MLILYGVDPKKDWGFQNFVIKSGATADKCVGCGACEAACPQHLPIIDGLKEAWKEIG